MVSVYEYHYPGTKSLLEWNNMVTKIIKEKPPPSAVSRIYGLTHVSIYDSLVVGKNKNIDSKYRTYYFPIQPIML
jgi:hypothetical protein